MGSGALCTGSASSWRWWFFLITLNLELGGVNAAFREIIVTDRNIGRAAYTEMIRTFFVKVGMHQFFDPSQAGFESG